MVQAQRTCEWLCTCALAAAQGSARDREKRERERQQLADLGKWGGPSPSLQAAFCCNCACVTCLTPPMPLVQARSLPFCHRGACCRSRARMTWVPPTPGAAVGKNLTYLSQLDGLTFQLYRDIVLPRCASQCCAVLCFWLLCDCSSSCCWEPLPVRAVCQRL